VLLAGGIAVGFGSAVPVAVVLLGLEYCAALSIDDRPLDVRSALIGAGLLLMAELSFWSLELRAAIAAEPGSQLFRLAFVLMLATGALGLCAVIVAIVDRLGRSGFAIELLGAGAAVAALAAILLARPRSEGAEAPVDF
jgi:hypothetical protein